MKYLITHSKDREGTVINGDTLHRFIEEARAAADGDQDAVAVLPDTAYYVAERLADLIEYDKFMAEVAGGE